MSRICVDVDVVNVVDIDVAFVVAKCFRDDQTRLLNYRVIVLRTAVG